MFTIQNSIFTINSAPGARYTDGKGRLRTDRPSKDIEIIIGFVLKEFMIKAACWALASGLGICKVGSSSKTGKTNYSSSICWRENFVGGSYRKSCVDPSRSGVASALVPVALLP